MFVIKPTRLLLAGLAMLCFLLCPAEQAQAAVERYVLHNGLTVLLAENHEAPVAALQIWVGAGSAMEEPQREAGITHFIEHMIFKGTPTRSANEITQVIESLGGEVNAYTSLDHTKYYVVASSAHALSALDVLADAVVNSTFDPEEMEREKEVVVEEIRMNINNPQSRLGREVMSRSFGPAHPYGLPVLGTEESVRNFSRDDILNFRDKWYHPGNMIVVAVGDINGEEILNRLQEIFGLMPGRQTPHLTLPAPQNQGPQIEFMTDNISQASVTLTWTAPSYPNQDIYALQMAASILGQGRTSRLYEQIKEKQRLADGISADVFFPRDWGIFEIDAIIDPQQLSQAWPAILQEIYGLLSAPPRPEELHKANAAINASEVRKRQTMQGQADQWGFYEMFLGGFEKVSEVKDIFLALQAEQISRALKRHLTPQNLTVVAQLPPDAPVPDKKQMYNDLTAAWAAAVKASAALEEPLAHKHKLNNGLTVIIKPQQEVPLVSMTLVSPSGQAAEPASKTGLHRLWAGTLNRGSQGLDFVELQNELENLAAYVEPFSGLDASGLSGSFMLADWQRGLEIMAQIWQKPLFPEEHIERAKAEQTAMLRMQEDSPPTRAMKMLRQGIFGDHPYGRDPLGNMASIAALTRDDLCAAHDALQGPDGLVFCLVGPVEPEQVIAQLEKLWAGVKGQALEPALDPPLKLEHALIKQSKEPQARQSQILMGYAAPALTDADRYALVMWDAILGGMSGRLFTELREKRSLAYSVYPFYQPRRHSGSFGFYLGVGPDKEQEALEALQQEIAKTIDQPLTVEEMARARNYLLGIQAIEMQTYGAQAMTMATSELWGLGFDDYAKLSEHLLSLTPENMQNAARKVFGQPGAVTVVLGP